MGELPDFDVDEALARSLRIAISVDSHATVIPAHATVPSAVTREGSARVYVAGCNTEFELMIGNSCSTVIGESGEG